VSKKNVIAGLIGVLVPVFMIHGQTVNISGNIIDSVTLQPQANAVVSLVEDPSIKDTTDCYGAFVLGGTTRARAVPATAPAENVIEVRGDRLSILNEVQSDVTEVAVYNPAGVRIYHANKHAQPGTSLTFNNLWKTPGLYSVRIRNGRSEHVLTCLGTGDQTTGIAPAHSGSLGPLAKSSAAYTVSVAKIGFASKQVSASGSSANLGSIRLRQVAPTLPVTPMKIISQFVPLFVSGGQAYSSGANDTNSSSLYWCDKDTGWLAYDLSSKPVAARQMILLAWYDAQNGYFAPGGTGEPKDYTIEINNAPGGTCPVTGWVTVLSVTNNWRASRYHEVHMAGANWIRMHVSASYTTQVTWDMDIYDVSTGLTDAWLHLGDSNTAMYLSRWGTAFPNRIHDLKNNAWPCWEGAGIGGTSSSDALQRIDSVLINFPGKFICINHGTNDGWQGYYERMDTLVTKCMNAGRVPVIPTVPWRNETGGDPADSNTIKKNLQLARLYTTYPQILRGPDLWTLSWGHPNLIGGLHWSSLGSDSLRANWVRKVASVLK
jgi:hypothetical protein